MNQQKKNISRRVTALLLLIATLTLPHRAAVADDAAATTITLVGREAGPTPFIVRLQLTIDKPDLLTRIQFRIRPKAGSLARPLTVSYYVGNLEARGLFQKSTGEITLPVFGLYDGYENEVTINYHFSDGSAKQASFLIATQKFDDPCGYDNPERIVPRRHDLALSYDYILVKNSCGSYSPAVLDTDGALRWVGTAGISSSSSIFFDGAIYVGDGARVLRIELDGTYASVADYSSVPFAIHHNIDEGKQGMLVEVDTGTQIESGVIEIDKKGKILKRWDLDAIIGAAMLADGDDPSQFVRPKPEDWFHSNAVAYRKSDDTLLISSRENFVIALDYESGAIKWILGDTTKRWYDFPSLRKYALTLAPGSEPPIGQHALSFTQEDALLLFDNGSGSLNHTPPGETRTFSAARAYRIDTVHKTATEIMTYENGRSLYSPFCSSVYQDTGLSYVLSYSFITNAGSTRFAELIGLTATGEKAFAYRYPTDGCRKTFNAIPLGWHNLVYTGATSTEQATATLANISTRGVVRAGEEVLIAGFIIKGNTPKRMMIRGIGPSLSGQQVSNPILDPILAVHDAQNKLAENDNYSPSAELTALGSEPADPRESVVILTLPPGAYTAILRNKDAAQGVALVEVYDLGNP